MKQKFVVIPFYWTVADPGFPQGRGPTPKMDVKSYYYRPQTGRVHGPRGCIVHGPGECMVPGGAWSMVRGSAWSGGGPWWRDPPPRLLLRAVCILLECILVGPIFFPKRQEACIPGAPLRSNNVGKPGLPMKTDCSFLGSADAVVLS